MERIFRTLVNDTQSHSSSSSSSGLFSKDSSSFLIHDWMLSFSFKCKTEITHKADWHYLADIHGEPSRVEPGRVGGSESSTVAFTNLR